MKSFFTRLWKSSIETPTNQKELDLKNTCAGRVVSALTLIVVIACLALWITGFLLVMRQLSVQTLSGTVLSNLNCITFFGGLVLAIFIGAMAGNFLRRAFWKWLVRRNSK
jgi:hypothetical protein